MSELHNGRWLLTRPDLKAATIMETASTEYHLNGTVSELGSQQDRNFLVTGDSDQLMLKVYNPETPLSVIELQDAVTDALQKADLHTPAIRRTSSGELGLNLTTETGEAVHARAYEFIEGGTLDTHAELTGVTAERLGELAGATAKALEPLTHPAAEREIQWEMRNAATVIETLLHHLPEDRRAACQTATAHAETVVNTVASSLPLQIIHGDLTCDNVIQDRMRELWIIDLGDVAKSWRIAELAVTAADIFGRTGDLSHVIRAVTGFSKHITLSDAEITALWPLMVLRGAVLAVSGWSQLAVDPGNDYARERIEHEWKVLERTLNVNPSEAHAALRLAAGLPHREGLTYRPLFADLAQHSIIDLSVTSPLLDRGVWLEPNIEETLASTSEATIAVARFGEARLTRTNPDVGKESFTRARGVQLWAPVGTPAYAPFGGVVSSTGTAVTLSDRGLTLTITGLTPADHASEVRAGDLLGTTAETSIFITRQFGNAPSIEHFGRSDAPYSSVHALDPSLILGVEAANDVDLIRTAEQLRRDRAMGEANERYYDTPPQIERGWRTLLIDTAGRPYLDMVNNVTAIGHANPVLADRVCRQLNLLNTNNRFLYSAYAEFTEKLLAHSPHPSLDTVIPVNSGSEALDLAIRLAQVATGRKTIVAAREGYHGWTMASDAVSTSAFDNPNALGSRPEWVEIVDAPNAYRGTHQGPDAGARYAEDAAAHFTKLVEEGRPPAAFLSEPVLGNAGGVIPPEGYLEAVYDSVRSVGGVVIADEVQVGYGRLGKTFWANEMLGAVPDIIATAKAAGNAYPIGAVITRSDIVEALQKEGMFFSSAGGAPASAIAGSAVLDEIAEQGLQENALELGTRLIQSIKKLAERHDMIGIVHGSGLYIGVELVKDRVTKEPATAETAAVCDRLLEHGIIMQATSERQNVLKVKPPMVITSAEVDMFVSALDQTLTELF